MYASMGSVFTTILIIKIGIAMFDLENESDTAVISPMAMENCVRACSIHEYFP